MKKKKKNCCCSFRCDSHWWFRVEEGKGGGRKEVLVVRWRRLSRRLPDRIVSFKNMSNPTLCVLLRCLTPFAGMKKIIFCPLPPRPTNHTPTTPSWPGSCVTINSLHSFELTQFHTHTHTVIPQNNIYLPFCCFPATPKNHYY